jgi:phage protein D
VQLSELDKSEGSFYVPSYVVKVGGEDLLRDLLLAVTSVEVSLKQKAAGHFKFVVANAFDWESRQFVGRRQEKTIDLLDVLGFGRPVEISLGYSQPSKLRLLLKGVITDIETNFSENGTPELTISGYDKLYPLTNGKNTRHWEKRADSDVVRDLVAPTGLKISVQQTTPEKPRIDQNQETDMAFLIKLAERNGATFYAQGDSFYFGPRNNDKTEVIELAWGKGLMTFSPQANLAKQITRVEVYGRSATDGKPIKGVATKGEESGKDSSRSSGSQRLAQALGNEASLKIRSAVHTQAEADALAKSILEERGQEFVKGSGESLGLKEIVPDINIALSGLGKVFSKTYYVDECSHTISSGGYRTSFQVQETSV